MSVHQYSYKPVPEYKDTRDVVTPGKKLFMGFELEVEVANGDYYDVSDNLEHEISRKDPDRRGFFYCKEDGSLDDGFEVVSHPMTWDWIKAKRDLIVSTLKYLEEHGAKSYDTSTCGLHIHVSKSALGKRTLQRMLEFVFSNPGLILKISRRQQTKLDEWAACRLDDYNRRTAMSLTSTTKTRRLALNTLPKHTAEFRLFRGTLNPVGFFRALEFVHACVSFCRGGAPILNVTEFARFVRSNKAEYPNLHRFLLEAYRIGIKKTKVKEKDAAFAASCPAA